MCNHKICSQIKIKKGVSCVILNNYNRRNGEPVVPVILLGLERNGQYKNTYSICSGKLESYDKGCLITRAMMELKQEFKIDLNYDTFDFHFKKNDGNYRLIIHNTTPIFIGIFTGLSRQPINYKI